MNIELKVGILSAIVSLFLAFLALVLKRYEESRQEKKKTQLEYLNPLRLYLIEIHFRLNEIRKLGRDEKNSNNALTYLGSGKEISNQTDEWFNGRGCYLASSSYIAACLFASIYKCRNSMPFLRLSSKTDTKLLSLTTKISLGFLREFGVFYITQFSIGKEMINECDGDIKSYKEFCRLICTEDSKEWFVRLIDFFIDTGKGLKIDRIDEILKATNDLSIFLDKSIGHGESIKDRYIIEGIEKL